MTLRSNTTLGNFYAEKDAGGNLIALPHPARESVHGSVVEGRMQRPSAAKAVHLDAVDAANGKQQPVEQPCSPLMNMTGIAFAFRYTGAFAILLAAAVSAKRWAPAWRGKQGRDYRFLAWVLGVGLLLNLLPVRWNDPNGTNGENLQAWLLLLAAVTVAGLVRLPRAALLVLGLAFAIEHARADWELIRIQSIVLPFSHHQTATAGHPPIGIFGPWPPSEGPFFAPAQYSAELRMESDGRSGVLPRPAPAGFQRVLLGLSRSDARRWRPARGRRGPKAHRGISSVLRLSPPGRARREFFAEDTA